jgi:hypothetical protein
MKFNAETLLFVKSFDTFGNVYNKIYLSIFGIRTIIIYDIKKR